MTAFWIAIGAVFIALGASAIARMGAQAKTKARNDQAGGSDTGWVASDTSSSDCGSGGDGGGGGCD
ncbi:MULTISPECIES: hypothetical protein [unclassified Sphingomonas]|jgi:pectate lyase|uniref:hypothetical protein n=1 Tax=unclassified Sphingomonas TaxID=196159 RepID=UPI000835490B|nr:MULTISPECIES: hypothetical protein [unclassified Sphingomonas]MCH4891913.1 hypothetical protein [Sphingomonas sp. SFZ2018-12]